MDSLSKRGDFAGGMVTMTTPATGKIMQRNKKTRYIHNCGDTPLKITNENIEFEKLIFD